MFLIVVVLIAIAFVGFGIGIFIKGKPPETHIGKNIEMKKLGITCAKNNSDLCQGRSKSNNYECQKCNCDKLSLILVFLFFSFSVSSQDDQDKYQRNQISSPLSLDEAVSISKTNHPIARNAALAEMKDALTQKQKRNRKAQHNLKATSTRQAERVLKLDELAWKVKSAYMEAVYFRQRLQIFQEHASYFEALIDVTEIHLSADTISELVWVSAGTQYGSFQCRMYIAEEELLRAETHLLQLLYFQSEKIELKETELNLYLIHPNKPLDERFEPVKHKALSVALHVEAESALKLVKRKYKKQAEIDLMIKVNETGYRQFFNRLHVTMLKSRLNEYYVQISYSKENLLLEAQLVMEEIKKDFSAERISNYAEAFKKVNNAVSVKLNHLEYIFLYNQTALELEYYTQ